MAKTKLKSTQKAEGSRDLIGRQAITPVATPAPRPAPVMRDAAEQVRAPGTPSPRRAQAMSALQRSVGNRRVSRMVAEPRGHPADPDETNVKRLPVQAKLTVGRPGDRYEQEADAAARRVEAGQPVDKVSRLPAGGLAQTLRRDPEEEEPLQMTALQRQEVPEEEEDLQMSTVQRMCTECEAEDRAQRQPEEEEELLQGAALRRQADEELIQGAASRPQEEEEPLQAKTAGGEPGLDTGRAARAMNEAGSGSALSPTMQSEMGQRFGADFSNVRVHTGGGANEAAQAINARALTRGSDIYMGQGASPTDRRLMAHELTHVVQQGGETKEAQQLASGTLARDIAMRDDPPVEGEAGSEPASRLNGEPFVIVGPQDAPRLIISRQWLIDNGVPSGANSITGSSHPQIFEPIIAAFVERYSWGSMDLARQSLPDMQITWPDGAWQVEEMPVRVLHSVFRWIGLPSADAVQVFRVGSVLQVFADTRHRYPESIDAGGPDIGEVKRRLSEEMIAALETAVGAPMLPLQRSVALELFTSGLTNERNVQVATLDDNGLVNYFGEEAARAYLGREVPREGGSIIRIPGNSLVVPENVTSEDVQLVRRLLEELFGSPQEGEASEGEQGQVVTSRDIEALRRLDQMEEPDRIELVRIIQEMRSGGGATAAETESGESEEARRPRSPTIAEIIETAIAIRQTRAARSRLGLQPPTGGRGLARVPRPVRGRIVNRTGEINANMEAHFAFRIENRETIFAVPRVFIDWYAYREEESGALTPVDHDRTGDVTDLPDRLSDYEVRFAEPGRYQIHAFVNHSFYLPNHFEQRIEVLSQSQRLAELEAAGAEGWGRVTRSDEYRFTQVATENALTSAAIWVASGPSSAAISLISNETESGERAYGLLAEGREAGATVSEQLNAIDGELERLNDLIDTLQRDDPVREAAESRRDRLIALRGTIGRRREDTQRHSVNIQGFFATRQHGARNAQLQLVCFFERAEDGTYSGEVYDRTEHQRAETLHYTTDGHGTFEAMTEALFVDITKSYVNGTMSVAFQIYESVGDGSGVRATNRFVRYRRVTDTLLGDIEEVLFSQTAQIVVNLAATLLTLFPPTAPLGIGIGIAYNAAQVASQIAGALRTDTFDRRDCIDLGLLIVDLIPVVGRASRLIRVGQRTYRVLEVGQLAGDAFLLTDTAIHEIGQIRDGEAQRLAITFAEIQRLEAENAADPRLRELRAELQEQRERLIGASERVIFDLAQNQLLMRASQAALRRAAEPHLSGRGGEGATPRPEGEGATPRPETEGTTPRPSGEGVTPRPAGEGATPRPGGESARPRPEGETPAPRTSASDPGLAAHGRDLHSAVDRHLQSMDVDPAQTGHRVEVMDADTFRERFGSERGRAVFMLDADGRPVIYAREDATRFDMLGEAAHVAQMRSPEMAERIRVQGEVNLADWANAPAQYRLDMFRNKLEIEIDAANRARETLGNREDATPAEIASVERNLRQLQELQREVDSLTPEQLAGMNAGVIPMPQYLREPSRLFQKTTATEGVHPSRFDLPSDMPRNRVPAEGNNRSPAYGREGVESVEQIGQTWRERTVVTSGYDGQVVAVQRQSDGTTVVTVETGTGTQHRYTLEAGADVRVQAPEGDRLGTRVQRGDPPLGMEESREYRLVEIRYAGEPPRTEMREEIRSTREGRDWVQRGSESTARGAQMETAARRQIDVGLQERQSAGAISGSARIPHRRGGGGFDDVIVEFSGSGPSTTATLRIIEVKDYPNRYVPLAEFTAIRGSDWRANLEVLRDSVTSARAGNPPDGFPDMSANQLRALERALRQGSGAVRVEVMIGPTTRIGTEGVSGSRVLGEIRTDVDAEFGAGTLGGVTEGYTPTRVEQGHVTAVTPSGG